MIMTSYFFLIYGLGIPIFLKFQIWIKDDNFKYWRHIDYAINFQMLLQMYDHLVETSSSLFTFQLISKASHFTNWAQYSLFFSLSLTGRYSANFFDLFQGPEKRYFVSNQPFKKKSKIVTKFWLKTFNSCKISTHEQQI